MKRIIMITTPVLNIDEQIKRVACISDIHGNLEALSAVFHDIQDKGIENILCVGDVVGYGADPGPCIDIMRNNNILTVQGNHDSYVCSDRGMDTINSAAFKSIVWTREHVSDQQKEWLARLPLIINFDKFSVVHGSLSNPDRWEYVLDVAQSERCFLVQDKPFTIIGHSHRPYLYSELDGKITGEVLHTKEFGKRGKYIINAGSVGQPRDKQYLATYLIFEIMNRTASIERVAYDVETAKRKILESGLPAHNAKRLSPSVIM